MGYKNVRAMQEADKQRLFPDLLLHRQETINQLKGRVCSTHRQYILGQTQYFTCDPKNVQAILATQFQDFDLGPARRGNMIATLGDGIFVQDGKAWEHSRAMLRPNFVRDQVSDLDLEERHVQNLMNLLKIGPGGWTAETDIQTLFFRLTIDSATEFLFGESVDSQMAEAHGAARVNKGPAKVDELAFSKNFDAAQRHMAKRFRFAGEWFDISMPILSEQLDKLTIHLAYY
jgi:cytochrome P450